MLRPEVYQSAAGRLDCEADLLAVALDPVARAFAGAMWTGPAADAFRDGLEQRRQALRYAASQLHGCASHLRALAQFPFIDCPQATADGSWPKAGHVQ